METGMAVGMKTAMVAGTQVSIAAVFVDGFVVGIVTRMVDC